jgi:hypothetical protein
MNVLINFVIFERFTRTVNFSEKEDSEILINILNYLNNGTLSNDPSSDETNIKKYILNYIRSEFVSFIIKLIIIIIFKKQFFLL